jgi:glutamine amidotransferase
MIAIVDYGFGNVRSLRNALEYLGQDVVITGDGSLLMEADRVVLPGVGAFGDAMDAIHARGLKQPLTQIALETRKPVFGICLGMQLFARESLEHGHHQGLSWLDSRIEPILVDAPLKVPHVGWNDIQFSSTDWLFSGIKPKEANFYFVHSFHMVCQQPGTCIATAQYGSPLTAVVRQGNLVATQFHPEKSQDNGLRLLQNWLDHDFTVC